MRHFYFIIILVSFFAKAQSPTFQWGKAIGSTTNENGNSVAIDASGNIITVGKFDGTADFDPSAAVLNLTSAGGYDVFITKMDPDGNLLWAKRIGNLYGNEDAYAVKTDASGNIYVCGVYYRECDMDPGAGSTVLTQISSPLGGASSLNDSFLLKLDSNGNFAWARALAKSEYNASPRWGNYADALAIDNLGNVIVTGYFTGRTLIADTVYYQANTTGAGTAADMFVMKYSSTGVLQWHKQIGSNTNESPTGIIANASGIYITGHFNGILDFDPSSTAVANFTPTGGYDSFLLKLDANGNFTWVKKTSGTADEYGRALTFDNSGNVIWGGNYLGTVDFDPSASTSNITSNGNTDNFISKMDTSGNYFWTYSFGGINGDFLSALAVDSDNNIYSTGNFSGTVDFDSGSGATNYTSNGGPDIYIEKISTAGAFVWAWAFGGQSLGGTIDVGNGLALDASNNLTLVGNLFGNADVWLDPNFTAGSRVTPNGGYDLVMLKIQSGTLSTQDFNSNNLKFSMYPNPAKDILNISLDSDLKSVEIYSLQGQKVFSSNEKIISISNLSNGIYMVKVEDVNGAVATTRLIKS